MFRTMYDNVSSQGPGTCRVSSGPLPCIAAAGGTSVLYLVTSIGPRFCNRCTARHFGCRGTNLVSDCASTPAGQDIFR